MCNKYAAMEADCSCQPLDGGNNLVEDVYNYLVKVSYPSSATRNIKERVIRNKAKKFSVKEGVLHYLNVKRGLGSKEVTFFLQTNWLWRYIVYSHHACVHTTLHYPVSG